MIGLAAAIAAYVQGLSRLRRNQETVRLAWADAYTQTLTAASELSCWKHLADLLRRFFPQHVFARIAEVGRADPGSWKEINGAKHCALALPALLIATTHGLTSVVEEVVGFVSMAGPLRQYLDDYADVLEDLCDKKFNWWAHELAQWAGDIRQSQWPQVLATRALPTSLADALSRMLEAFSAHPTGSGPLCRHMLRGSYPRLRRCGDHGQAGRWKCLRVATMRVLTHAGPCLSMYRWFGRRRRLGKCVHARGIS